MEFAGADAFLKRFMVRQAHHEQEAWRGAHDSSVDHTHARNQKANCMQLALFVGGEEEDRTPDLRIANAALSQLSYPPNANFIIATVSAVRSRTRKRRWATAAR